MMAHNGRSSNNGTRRWIGRQSLIFVASLICALMLVASAQGQASQKALSKEDVVKLLAGSVSPKRVGALATERGIDFKVTPQIERELLSAGADPALIATLKALAFKSQTAVTPPPASATPSTDKPAARATAPPSQATKTPFKANLPSSAKDSSETSVDPRDMRFDFGKLPPAGEDWLKAPYNPPADIQQERLQLSLYWVSRFLADAKARNTQSEAVQLLLRHIPKKIYCVNTQNIHLSRPIMGGAVLAGMKNSFDASLPDIAMDLLASAESLVYQFNSGQPDAETGRAEIAKQAMQFFASQPLDPQAPDPFLVAARTPQPLPDQWKLLTLARVWDCPNPYHFFEAQNGGTTKLDEDTVAHLKEEKAIVTELNLDGVFNKDKQGHYRNDQGALSPLGMLFQLTLREPAGLFLLGRAEENERVIAANAQRAGNGASATAHLAKANEIAGLIETVNTLRKAVPDAYLDLYLTKVPPPEKRSTRKPDPQMPDMAAAPREPAPWNSRWLQYKDRWVLIAGIRQSDIPINSKAIEHLADALNEKLPAGVSVLPALELLKESVQYSSNPQYAMYASMFDDIDHRGPAAVAETPPSNDR